MDLAQRMSFEKAMADPAYAKCIRNYAEALERQRLLKARGLA